MGSECVGVAEDDVVHCASMKSSQQLCDAETEHIVQTRLVRFQQNAYSVYFFETTNKVYYVITVFLILLSASCVSNSRCIN